MESSFRWNELVESFLCTACNTLGAGFRDCPKHEEDVYCTALECEMCGEIESECEYA